MSERRFSGVVIVCLVAGTVCWAQGVDPRTPAGQLTVCGGEANWRAVGFLEFKVDIKTATSTQGPWLYQWGRRDGLLRLQGPSPNGGRYDIVIDIASRSGGAWLNGAQLTGNRLGDAINWALQRFGEDMLWVTFPLEWGAAQVVVETLPSVAEGEVTFPMVEVKSPVGTWNVRLDPETGRVFRTVFERKGMPTLTVTWSDWKQVAGLYFAGQRTIAETGETIDVQVMRALPQSPSDVF